MRRDSAAPSARIQWTAPARFPQPIGQAGHSSGRRRGASGSTRGARKSRSAIQNHVIERLERSQIPPALKDRFHLDDPNILARDAPAP
jgi:hypothetical protein